MTFVECSRVAARSSAVAATNRSQGPIILRADCNSARQRGVQVQDDDDNERASSEILCKLQKMNVMRADLLVYRQNSRYRPLGIEE
jgi:RNA:NAD 2'-phosphotransferase (TPT1/KptA family)